MFFVGAKDTIYPCLVKEMQELHSPRSFITISFPVITQVNYSCVIISRQTLSIITYFNFKKVIYCITISKSQLFLNIKHYINLPLPRPSSPNFCNNDSQEFVTASKTGRSGSPISSSIRFHSYNRCLLPKCIPFVCSFLEIAFEPALTHSPSRLLHAPPTCLCRIPAVPTSPCGSTREALDDHCAQFRCSEGRVPHPSATRPSRRSPSDRR